MRVRVSCAGCINSLRCRVPYPAARRKYDAQSHPFPLVAHRKLVRLCGPQQYYQYHDNPHITLMCLNVLVLKHYFQENAGTIFFMFLAVNIRFYDH